jgi:hypothetical protein
MIFAVLCVRAVILVNVNAVSILGLRRFAAGRSAGECSSLFLA